MFKGLPAPSILEPFLLSIPFSRSCILRFIFSVFLHSSRSSPKTCSCPFSHAAVLPFARRSRPSSFVSLHVTAPHPSLLSSSLFVLRHPISSYRFCCLDVPSTLLLGQCVPCSVHSAPSCRSSSQPLFSPPRFPAVSAAYAAVRIHLLQLGSQVPVS